MTHTFCDSDIEPIAPRLVRVGDLLAVRGDQPGEWHAHEVTYVRDDGTSTRIEYADLYLRQPYWMPVRIVRRDHH